MMEEKVFSSLEKRLRETVFYDSQGNVRAVWQRYRQIKEGKEAYMKKLSLRVVTVLSLMVLFVVGGFFGMKWMFHYQKTEKMARGEAILVTMTIGDVQVRKMGSDQWREAVVDDILEMGDTLRTGEDSSCEIQILERGVYHLEANTEMLVSRLVNEDEALQARVHVEKGTMALKPKKLKKGEVFEVESSTAVAAVRGTVFMVTVTEDGNTKVAVSEGKVSLTPKVTTLEKAKREAKIDEKAYQELQNIVAAPVEILANEEVVLDKQVVETINKKVAEVVDTKASADGPITVEKVEEVRKAIVEKVTKEFTEGRPVETNAPSLVGVLVQKNEISEEGKKVLESVQNREEISKKRVSVNFSADVPGALVTLNGVEIGSVPVARLLNVDKSYTVVFEKEGYETLSQEITVVDVTNIAVKLTAVAVQKQITEITNAQVTQETNEKAVVEATGTQPKAVAKASQQTSQQVKETTNEVKPLPKPGDIVWEKPFAHNVSGMIVVVARGGASADRLVSSVDNRIVVMNLEGEVLKSFVVGKGTTYEFPLVTTSKGIFTRDDDGVVYGYDYEGNQLWSLKLPRTPAWVGMTLSKKGLLVPVVQNKIHFIDTRTGAIVQTIEAGGQIYASPTMVDEKLLVYAQENGVVVGYDTAAGAELWRKEIGKRFIFPLSSADTKEDKVVVLPMQGKLLALNALNGEVAWEYGVPGSTFATKPFAVGKNLYVVEKNRLEVLDIPTGKVVSKLLMKADILSVQTDMKSIYVLDASGQVKVATTKGEALWTYNAESGAQGLALHPEGVYVFKKGSVVRLVGSLPSKK